MNPKLLLNTLALSVGLSFPALATVRYVNLNNPQPAAPYTNWGSAAQTIQDAVDAADPGDQVLVTNGVYKTGGMFYGGLSAMSNRVAVTKPVLLSSVNGPDVTLIQGVQEPNTLVGPGAVRCVYLTGGAEITGFTLTNGATLETTVYGIKYSGGGVYAISQQAMVSNCIIVANAAYDYGGGAYGASLYNCIISNNSVWESSDNWGGGGVAVCSLNHCIVAGNTSVRVGGGADGSTLIDCSINSNTAGIWGGGVSACTLNHCGVTNNFATYAGGGAYYSILTNSFVVSNYASEGAGLSWICVASNCLVAFNRADTSGAGAGESVDLIDSLVLSNYAGQSAGGVLATSGFGLKRCTLAGNSAPTGAAAVNAILNSCTLNNNTANYGGATADCEMTNCTVSGNTATVTGGGAYGGTLVNCLVTGNTAGGSGGGGANDPNMPLTLINCTVAGNWSTNSCGGVDGGTIYNSIVYGNNASSTPNYSPYDSAASTGTLFTNSCTTPLPNAGTGNITGDPLFIEQAGANFRLQTNSPCINAGDNASVVTTNDLDGRPRILGGTVDMGAYEFQGDGIGEFTAWLLHYGLPTDGSTDYVDTDAHGMNNWQEWICDTNPTNALSVLRMLSISSGPSGPTVIWQSANTRDYFLQRSVAFLRPPVFVTVATNIVGQAGVTTYVDTTANDPRPLFYRVGVHQ